jgi:hypothetical protein
MIDTFDRAALWRLTSHHVGPCVSLFLETHPAGRDGEQDAIRLKNLLREAEHQLSGHWLSATEARSLLERPRGLPKDADFWSNRSQGLAIFAEPGGADAYRVALPFAEQVVVTNRFRVRPMLPLWEQQLSFFLLAISENQVAFYAIDEQSIEKMDVPGLPANLAESLNYTGADRGSQVHSAMRDAKGKQGAVFHGQGGQRDTSKDDRSAYCGDVDKAVTAWLGDSNRPVLLAGVDNLVTLYRQKSAYKYLLEEVYAGNHDRESEHELHRGACRIAQPLLQAETAKVAQRYAERSGTNRVTDDPGEVVAAAMHGRVDWLLYDPQAELFGQVDQAGTETRITGKSDDDDLVEMAAVETLRNGGAIGSMTQQDVPSNSPLAAILRY